MNLLVGQSSMNPSIGGSLWFLLAEMVLDNIVNSKTHDASNAAASLQEFPQRELIKYQSLLYCNN